MSLIKNRDEVVSFISTNFNFLRENGFQIVDVEFALPKTMFWAVDFEEKCRIRISWYWHDGLAIMISKPGAVVNEYWKWYSVDTLAGFIMGEEIVGKFYDEKRIDNSDYQVQVYSAFLSTHLNRIIDFVADEKFEKYDFELKQLRRKLDELSIEKYRASKKDNK